MNYQDITWFGNRIPKHCKNFLDIGANVGKWTSFMAQRSECVHAFEPYDVPFKELAKQTSKKVHVYNLAISDTNGFETLTTYVASGHGTLLERNPTRSDKEIVKKVKVEVRMLDSFNFKNVDFIKIDTEGGEFKVLQGAIGTLKEQRPKVWIECHSPETIQQCSDFLARINYKFELLDHPNHGIAKYLITRGTDD